MACDLGFRPSDNPKYYFLSYNTEDADRVGEIAGQMSRAGIELWYDKGIEYGEKWERTIAEKIYGCQSVILFFTRGILNKENSYVEKEHKMAMKFKKKIYVVMMDEIDDEDVPPVRMPWWTDIQDLQCIKARLFADLDAVVEEIVSVLTVKRGQGTGDLWNDSANTELRSTYDAGLIGSNNLQHSTNADEQNQDEFGSEQSVSSINSLCKKIFTEEEFICNLDKLGILQNKSLMPIGVDANTGTVTSINLIENYILFVNGSKMCGKTSFLRMIYAITKARGDTNFVIAREYEYSWFEQNENSEIVMLTDKEAVYKILEKIYYILRERIANKKGALTQRLNRRDMFSKAMENKRINLFITDFGLFLKNAQTDEILQKALSVLELIFERLEFYNIFFWFEIRGSKLYNEDEFVSKYNSDHIPYSVQLGGRVRDYDYYSKLFDHGAMPIAAKNDSRTIPQGFGYLFENEQYKYLMVPFINNCEEIGDKNESIYVREGIIEGNYLQNISNTDKHEQNDEFDYERSVTHIKTLCKKTFTEEEYICSLEKLGILQNNFLMPIGFNANTGTVTSINLIENYILFVNGSKMCGKTSFLRMLYTITKSRDEQNFVITRDYEASWFEQNENSEIVLLSDKEAVYKTLEKIFYILRERIENKKGALTQRLNRRGMFSKAMENKRINLFITDFGLFLKNLCEDKIVHKAKRMVEMIFEELEFYNIFFWFELHNLELKDVNAFMIMLNTDHIPYSVQLGGRISDYNYYSKLFDHEAMSLKERASAKRIPQGYGYLFVTDKYRYLRIPFLKD